MRKLVKAPLAESDLIDIWLYVSEDQPTNADRLLDRLNEAVMGIVEEPGIGTDRPELPGELKIFPVGNYNLYYRVDAKKVELVRVLPSWRDVEKIAW